MTPESRLAALFGLDEEGWARHANPRSGWTRFATLPLIPLVGWSRVWIGHWWLLLLALLILWLWVNPRLFPPPARRDAWITRGVLGEKIWAARDSTPALMLYGIAALAVWPMLAGLLVVLLGKLWFVDRMAWLHDDMTKDPR